jgi:hypothetical protein
VGGAAPTALLIVGAVVRVLGSQSKGLGFNSHQLGLAVVIVSKSPLLTEGIHVHALVKGVLNISLLGYM